MTFTLDRENNAIEFIKSLLRNIFLSQISLMGFASVLIISITVRLSVRIQVDISVGGAGQRQEATPVPSVCRVKSSGGGEFDQTGSDSVQQTVCSVVRDLILIINDCKINVHALLR